MDETTEHASLLVQLDSRARTIFREIVELYLETGEPVGSRTLSRRGVDLSPASIRNVMADLVELGLIESPHTSAGRAPTHAGLRLFVDGFLEVGDPAVDDKARIDAELAGADMDLADLLDRASGVLSGLTGGAGIVASPTRDAPVRQIDFVPLRPTEALAIIVTEDGDVENRLLALPEGLPATALIEAGNYLNARLKGHSLSEARLRIAKDLETRKAEIDSRVADLISRGIVEWSGNEAGRGRSVIVKGRANLIENARALGDLDHVRNLFNELERKEALLEVLDSAQDGDGFKLYIGAENSLFSLSGSSTIVAPYMSAGRKVVGALGVIGPVRLNYARIIPMVDYTARLIGQMVEGSSGRKKDSET